MNILPLMAQLGRNSILTQKLVRTLKEKLTPEELRDFNQWLQIVEQESRMKVNKEKRKLGFGEF